MIDIFGFLSYCGVFCLKRQNLLLLSFQCFFCLFLFFFCLSKIFDEILVVPPYFLGLTFDNIHLALKLNDFIWVIFCSFISFPVHFFVVLNLISILQIHFLNIYVLGSNCFIELFLKLFLFLHKEFMFSEKHVVFFFVDFDILIIWFKRFIVLKKNFLIVLKFHNNSFKFLVFFIKLPV